MKTNNLFRIALFAASITLFAVACKKDNQSSTGSTSANEQTAADDQTMVSEQDESTNNDAEAALSSSASISGASLISQPKSGGTVLGGNDLISLCGSTISYDTTSDTKSMTITYDSADCFGKNTRTGTIKISIPKGVHWRDAGATVTLDVNIKITRKSDGKSITIQGTKSIVNTSGGLLVDLATSDSIVHEITAQWTVTFNNGTTRTWNVAKHRVFTYVNGIVITTTNGLNSSYAESGTNRFGVNFTSSITAPKVIAQSCDFRLTSGQNTITRGDNITAIVTYGLDASGNATSCPGAGAAYYAKLDWSNSATGKSYSLLFQYW